MTVGPGGELAAESALELSLAAVLELGDENQLPLTKVRGL